MKHHRRTLTLMWLLAAVSVAVMVAVLLCGSESDTFTPPPFEHEAVVGTPSIPEGMGYGMLDAEAFQAALCGQLTAAETGVDLWLTNPSDNTVWLKLRLFDEEGNLLGETAFFITHVLSDLHPTLKNGILES